MSNIIDYVIELAIFIAIILLFDMLFGLIAASGIIYIIKGSTKRKIKGIITYITTAIIVYILSPQRIKNYICNIIPSIIEQINTNNVLNIICFIFMKITVALLLLDAFTIIFIGVMRIVAGPPEEIEKEKNLIKNENTLSNVSESELNKNKIGTETEEKKNNKISKYEFFKDNEIEEAYEYLESIGFFGENELTEEQYRNIERIRNMQRAFKGYMRRCYKDKWEYGRDYERYIGYICEKQKYYVEFRGALDGKEDMGRDLIIRKNHKTYIVQCKYWKKESIIHEKYIFQLQGTVEYMRFEERDYDIKGMFVTSSRLSEKAAKIARRFNIIVYENVEMKYNYPCIKCNINKYGEKIYHLPSDRSYDKCSIRNEGEFYAKTVWEAELKGFRRSKEWMHDK